MPLSPEEKFESYLRQFRPVAAPRLRREGSRRGTLLWRDLALLGATAILLITAGYLLRFGPERPNAEPNAYGVGASEVLTVGRANSLLATAPSFQSALNAISFRYPETNSTRGKTSALAVLSREKNRL